MAANMDVDFATEPFPEISRPVSGSLSRHAMPLPYSEPVKENAGQGKKSWSEIIKYVKQTRKLQADLNAKLPNLITFYQHQDHSRVYFIGVPEGKKDNTIMYVDVNDDGKPLTWQSVIDIKEAKDSDQALSKEEQLLQERKRSSLKGITSFILDPVTGRLVFPCSSKLHTCTPEWQQEGFATVSTLDTKSSGSKLDPKFCPGNPDLVSYVANGDLWVYDLYTNEDHRLTFSRNGKTEDIVSEPLSSGVPSYIVQEEFDRYTGYWWQPSVSVEDVYRILYEEVDESAVETISIPTASTEDHGVERHRYPRPGSVNAISNIKLAEVYRTDGRLESYQLELYTSLRELYPWMEYIVRAGWLPDGNSIYVQLLDRPQKKLALVLIPLGYFIYDKKQNVAEDAVPLVLHTEVSDIWVNVHNCLTFLSCEDSDPNLLRYIWASEDTGYAHLYLHTYDLKSQSRVSQVPLTSGEWLVSLDQHISLDKSEKFLFFSANKDTPLENHLYSVSLLTNQIQRLTPAGYSHQVHLNDFSTQVVSTYSSIQSNPCSKLFCITYTDNMTPHLRVVNTLVDQTDLPEDYKPPEIIQCPIIDNGKHIMYGMVYKPHGYEPGKKYPTVLYIYGGPNVQYVTNASKATRMLRLHTLASLGFAVVCFDGRGSQGRGLIWEGRLKNRMGTVEISDQVEGLQYVASSTHIDYIDLSRVAIHGWSYGGYMSLMGLVQRPDIFKISISCAPVTKWEFYDTGYTERYMSTPAENAQGYKNGSVLSYIDKFPDEENRLLLVHGMIDENVHLIHTTTLVNELLKACKPHRIQIYPNERHGIRNAESNQHFEAMVISYLQDYL